MTQSINRRACELADLESHSLDGCIQVKIDERRGEPPGSQLYCSSPDTHRGKQTGFGVVSRQLTAKQHLRSCVCALPGWQPSPSTGLRANKCLGLV